MANSSTTGQGRNGQRCRRHRATSATGRILALVFALTLTASCTGGDGSAGGSGGDDGSGTTSRTIREEIPTTVTGATNRSSGNYGPLPDPKWLDAQFTLEKVATAASPTAMAVRTGSDDLWITERDGRVRLIQRRVSLDGTREEVKLMNTVVLDITDKVSTKGEGGLLGLDFSLNGQELYVSYTNLDGNSVIAEYTMGAITAIADSERILLTLDQPYSNHNGGNIAIGPDGFLYIGFGDGGSGGDPEDNGQNLATMLGKILRIDPVGGDDDTPYGIPGGNPFIDQRNAPDEIWLYGVRNPWRFSFDQVTGDLWIADVGQNEVEEVDFLPAGAEPAGKGVNLGWRTMEGDQIFDARGLEDPTVLMGDYVGPVHTYRHDQGRCSVTGGYVYRGERLNPLKGVYLYSDYCSGELWGLQMLDDGRALWAPVSIDRTLGNPISFGQGPESELYVMEAEGDIVRIQGGRWRRSLRIIGPDESFTSGGFEREVLPGDGYVAPIEEEPIIDDPSTSTTTVDDTDTTTTSTPSETLPTTATTGLDGTGNRPDGSLITRPPDD